MHLINKRQGESIRRLTALLRSADLDTPGRRLACLLERQCQHAVLKLRADLLLVYFVRQREGPREVTDIVFGIKRLQALVFAGVDAGIDADKVKAECRDGILALYLARAERDKPRAIPLS